MSIFMTNWVIVWTIWAGDGTVTAIYPRPDFIYKTERQCQIVAKQDARYINSVWIQGGIDNYLVEVNCTIYQRET